MTAELREFELTGLLGKLREDVNTLLDERDALRAELAVALDRLIPEQVRCPICQTFLDDANEAHDCVVAAAPASIATLTARDAEHNRRAKLRAATRTAVALIAERDALRAVVAAADAMREAVICGFGVKVARELYEDARAAVKGDQSTNTLDDEQSLDYFNKYIAGDR